MMRDPKIAEMLERIPNTEIPEQQNNGWFRQNFNAIKVAGAAIGVVGGLAIMVEGAVSAAYGWPELQATEDKQTVILYDDKYVHNRTEAYLQAGGVVRDREKDLVSALALLGGGSLMIPASLGLLVLRIDQPEA